MASPFSGLQRHRLFWIRSQYLQSLELSSNFPRLDIGKLVAEELSRNPPGKYVSFDVDDFIKSLLRRKLDAQDESSRGLILENLGILLEPDLQLNPVKLFLELSLNAIVVLVWDHAIIDGIRFVWDESKPGYGFLFPSHTITNMEIPDEVP